VTASISTTTGSGTPVSLLVATAVGVPLPQNASTSLFQAASEVVTGTGHTVLFFGRSNAAQNDIAQVDISVDGVSIYNDSAGQQIVAKAVLSPGSHTVAFTAYALNTDNTMQAASLVALDLGL
jgi:hypothetical protein